jgi:hypothetical protein
MKRTVAQCPRCGEGLTAEEIEVGISHLCPLDNLAERKAEKNREGLVVKFPNRIAKNGEKDKAAA